LDIFLLLLAIEKQISGEGLHEFGALNTLLFVRIILPAVSCMQDI
jgi:hypothetical protein